MATSAMIITMQMIRNNNESARSGFSVNINKSILRDFNLEDDTVPIKRIKKLIKICEDIKKNSRSTINYSDYWLRKLNVLGFTVSVVEKKIFFHKNYQNGGHSF